MSTALAPPPENPFAHLTAAPEETTDTIIQRPKGGGRLDFGALFERLGWALAGLALVGLGWQYPWPVLILAVLYVIGFLFMPKGVSGAFGTAAFATHADMKRSGLLRSVGLILGRAQPERVGLVKAFIRLYTAPLRESQLVCMQVRAALVGGRIGGTPLIRLPFSKMVHLMTVAPPGAGKGVGQIIPALLSYPGSTVVIDPKGENHNASARARRKRLGNRIVRLDPFAVCGSGGAKVNPLDFISAKNPSCADQAMSLSEALVVETGREADPHWPACCVLAITAAILYVVTYARGKDRTLITMCDLLTDMTAFVGMVGVMQDAGGELEKTHGHLPAYPLLKRFGAMCANWKDRELGSVLSSISRHLAWMNSPVVSSHLEESTFDPRWLHKTSTTVYLILPPKYLTTLSRLLRLWLATIYGKLTETGAQEEKKVLFLLDEVGNLGPLPQIYQAITLGRGYGIRVWLCLQSMGQLKSIFPAEGQAQSVEASIDHRVFFGVRDYATADYLSNYLGQATVQIESTSTNEGQSETGSLAQMILKSPGGYSTTKSTGTSNTQSEVGRALLQPAEILRLRGDIAIILAKGVPPIKAELAKYYQTPELAEMVQANRPTTSHTEEA